MSEKVPEGFVWVCMVCGKRSHDKFGDEPISAGWDESCVLNSSIVKNEHLVLDSNGLICEINGTIYNNLSEITDGNV